MIETFRERVGKQSPLSKNLPLVHSAKGLVFQKIMNSGRLAPKFCDTMGKSTVFFFLGRPSYKYGSPDRYDARISYAPISIILDRRAAKTIARTFPFDTGSIKFVREEYNLDDDFELKDFCCFGNDAPEKLVKALWGDCEAYLRSRPGPDARDSVSPLDFQSQLLIELHDSGEANRIDDRVATIEVQVDEDVDLSKDNVVAFIVPDILSVSDEMKALAKEFEAEIVPYPWRRASNYQRATQIIDAALEYYSRKGI